MIINGTVNVTRISAIADKTAIAAAISSGLAAPEITRWRWHKVPTPSPDGLRKVFTLPDSEAYVSGTLRIYRDGLRLIKDTDYGETTANTFTMITAPDSNEVLSIDYLRPA